MAGARRVYPWRFDMIVIEDNSAPDGKATDAQVMDIMLEWADGYVSKPTQCKLVEVSKAATSDGVLPEPHSVGQGRFCIELNVPGLLPPGGVRYSWDHASHAN